MALRAAVGAEGPRLVDRRGQSRLREEAAAAGCRAAGMRARAQRTRARSRKTPAGWMSDCMNIIHTYCMACKCMYLCMFVHNMVVNVQEDLEGLSD